MTQKLSYLETFFKLSTFHAYISLAKWLLTVVRSVGLGLMEKSFVDGKDGWGILHEENVLK